MQKGASGDFTWPRFPMVGIVGGLGAMGRLFHRFFRSRGCEVLISDRATSPANEEVVTRADVVLFSLPLQNAEEIIRPLVSLTRPGQLLVDICSLKVDVMKTMEASPASVVGLHPMFGPYVSTVSGQTMIVCPGKRVARDAWEWLTRTLESEGLKLHVCTPEEHDRMMTVIQLLPHLTTVVLGHTLRRLRVDVAESLNYTSPIYRLEVDLIGRIFAQDPALYGAIGMDNPFKAEALEALQDAFLQTVDQMKRSDREAFARTFRDTADFFGDFCRQALEETNRLLDWHNGRKNSNPGRLGCRIVFPEGIEEAGLAAHSEDASTSRVWIESQSFSRLKELLHRHFARFEPVAVVDAALQEHLGTELESLGREVPTIFWEAKESEKRLASVERLAEDMVRQGAHRGSILVAVGGGVTGDVVGFLAAVYMRGIPVIQVPTTLLAQVDSCLGGKTGVDLPSGKNLVGSFHHPAGVLVDPFVCRSLPEAEWQNGMAEVIKYGLLDSEDLFGNLEDLVSRAPSRRAAYPLPDSVTERIVRRCLAIKARIVMEDERDFGLRQLLNLGHTGGHAIEVLSDYSVPHGQAVALGMRVAVRLGTLLGKTEPSLEHRLVSVLEGFGLPIRSPLEAPPAALVQALMKDKKKDARGPVWIIPKAPGEVERVRDIPQELVVKAFEVVAGKA